MNLMDALNQIEFLKILGTETLQKIVTLMEPRMLQKDSYLFVEKENSRGLYFLESGKISLLQAMDADRLMKVKGLEGPTVFEEYSLLDPSSRKYSALCESVCQVQYLSSKNFEQVLLNISPDTARLFYTKACENLSSQIRAIESDYARLQHHVWHQNFANS